MYSTLPHFVLGFHGCDKEMAEKVLSGECTLFGSHNDYDWLGHGIYFWENNPERAFEWAEKVKREPHLSKYKIDTPCALGTIIDLGHCLNLTESKSVKFLRKGYKWLCETFEKSDTQLPPNVDNSRKLDCAVINILNKTIDSFVTKNPQQTDIKKFDSIRGLFIEGDSVYDGSAFKEQTHIQISVRNPNCIKGYFRVLEQDKNFPLP